jgi:integrase/recombinase XerD
MTKGRHARNVFVSAKLKSELQAYAQQAKCVDRNYPFFASQKSIRVGFNANSLAQTFAPLYEGAELELASCYCLTCEQDVEAVFLLTEDE